MIKSNYTLVISGGPMPHAAEVLSCYVKNASKVICADSGVDYALKAGVAFDKVYGDFDSISSNGLDYIKNSGVAVEVFPCEKDMTDTELVLSEVEGDIVLFCALRGRIDHVMANLLMCSRYVKDGRQVMVTDGSTKVYFLNGEDNLSYETLLDSKEVVTLLPMDMNEDVIGVTTEGLYYELNNATLKYGYSLGVSNKFKTGETKCKISIKSGIMAVLIGNEE